MGADLSRGFFFVLALASAVAFFPPHAVAEEQEEQQAQAADAEPSEAETNDDEGDGEETSEDKKKQGEREGTKNTKNLFDEVMKLNVAPSAAGEGAAEAPAAQGSEDGATATVPLVEYTDLARRVAAIRTRKTNEVLSRVVLGAASYEGDVDGSVLSLRMKLVVTLAGDGLKYVPLVGDDVALVAASAGGESIGVTRRPGYHVWVTDRTGVVTIELSLLVGPRGGRGSIEYAFRSARTPSTRALIRLPSEGLSPRFDGAVENEVRAERGGTTARATLAPTTEIRVVGFRDVGGEEQARARAVAETISLLSVDERAIELFTVVRYTILRGAMQSFDVELPEGLDVVSADGEGAFHHSEERKDGKMVLRGETALPIEGTYEVSLRLRMRGAAGKNALDVRLPHCLGVEREHGWLAVEVPGKLRVEETSRKDIVAVSVPELPNDARRGAVSPVLRAYRHHESAPALGLSVERLPEQELDLGAIDAVEATSVLASEGKLVTELRITLRNASRPSLGMTLPAGAEVRSALLRGEPVRPSRDEAGRLLLPLDRSGGEGHDEPMVLEVVVESSVPPLGLFGAPELFLPSLDLGAASLKWRMYLPAHNRYGDLEARISEQTYAGAASWHKPPHLKRAVRWNDEEGSEKRVASSRTPSWSELVSSGTEKVHERYWVPAGESVRIRAPFVRGFLLLPLEVALAAAFAIGIFFAYRRRSRAITEKVPLGRQRGSLATRLLVWFRRQSWTRRRVARAVVFTMSVLVVSVVFLERVRGLTKILVGLVGGDA